MALDSLARRLVVNGQHRRLNPNRKDVFIYRDNISVDALLLAVTAAERLKRTLWHEVGHALGLHHDDADGANSIMNEMPAYASQADVDTCKSRVDKMHWSDTEATRVRRDYVPNAE